MTGTIRLGASATRVDGVVGGVRLDRGGMVTIGKDGRVTGLAGDDADTAVIHSESGELAVLIRQADGETVTAAAGRVEGRIEEAGNIPEVSFQAAGAMEPLVLGAPGTKDSVPSGAFDVGVVVDGGSVRTDSVGSRVSLDEGHATMGRAGGGVGPPGRESPVRFGGC